MATIGHFHFSLSHFIMGNAHSEHPSFSTLPPSGSTTSVSRPSAGAGSNPSTHGPPSAHEPTHVAGVPGGGSSTGNPFLDAMERAKTRHALTEKGAPALSVADVVEDSPLSGLLVTMNTSSVGTRGAGKTEKKGTTRQAVVTFVRDAVRGTFEEAKHSPEGAAAFATNLFTHLAYTRDREDGKGERDIAYWMIIEYHRFFPALMETLMPCLTHETYGSFKDLNRLLEEADMSKGFEACRCSAGPDSVAHMPRFVTFVKDMWVRALRRDMEVLASGKGSLSLAGKWAPRQNSHTAKVCKGLVRELALALFPYAKEGSVPEGHVTWALGQYRRTCSRLNAALGTIEVKMCKGEWKEIDPTRVPGRCHVMQRNAFLNRDKKGEERSKLEDRRECAEAFKALYAQVKANPKEAAAKGLIKTKTLTPLDIISTFITSHHKPADSDALEAMWATMVEEQREKFGKEGGIVPGIPICDVSGSMSGKPLEACIGLGLLLANLMPEPWRGRIMTFTSEPAWHHVPVDGSLWDQVQSLKSAPWQMSTDFAKAMRLILSTAVKTRCPLEHMPFILITLTDMQFDTAETASSPYNSSGYGLYGFTPPARSTGGAKKWSTVHDTIGAEFASAGYNLPFMVYWNLRAAKMVYQATSTQPGCAMLSGFSSSAFAAFCSSDPSSFREMTPMETLQVLLDRPIYDRVRLACDASTEGLMAHFHWSPPVVEEEGVGEGEGTGAEETKDDDEDVEM